MTGRGTAGVRRMVVAKLRERGDAEDAASTLADARLGEAVEYWNARYRAHRLGGMSLETACDRAFEDLAAWAATLG